MRQRLLPIISALLVLLFAYTGSNKLSDYPAFVRALQQVPLLGPAAAWLAWVVPAIELVLAFLLLFPATRRQGLFASLVLLTLFTVYICAMLLFAPNLPCSCGGAIGNLSWKMHVAMNMAFIILSLTGIQFCRVKSITNNAPER